MKQLTRFFRRTVCLTLALLMACSCAQAAPGRDVRDLDLRVNQSLKAFVNLMGGACLLRDVRELKENETPSDPLLEDPQITVSGSATEEQNYKWEYYVNEIHEMDNFVKDLVNTLAEYADAFESIAVGEPLVNTDADFAMTAAVLADFAAAYNDGRTAIVFMGHGTEAASNEIYARMQQVMTAAGYENCYIGTVEAEPSLDDVLAMVQAGDYDRVVLRPMMIVAGDHANNDMGGDDEDSWKSVFESAGYEVECVLEGLGQVNVIQQMFVRHAAEAMAKLG